MRHCFVERSDGPATGDLRVTHVRSGPQVDPLTANAPPWARPAALLAESDEHVEAPVRLRGSMRQGCRHCVGVGARQAAAIAGWYPSRWAKFRDVLKAFTRPLPVALTRPAIGVARDLQARSPRADGVVMTIQEARTLSSPRAESRPRRRLSCWPRLDETWLGGENVAEPAQRVVHPCPQGPDVDAQLAGHVPVGTVEHDGLQDGAAMVLADLRECGSQLVAHQDQVHREAVIDRLLVRLHGQDCRAAHAGTDHVDRHVGGDRNQPVRHWPARRIERRATAPRPREGLLDGLFGQVRVEHDAPRPGERARPVRGVRRRETVLGAQLRAPIRAAVARLGHGR